PSISSVSTQQILERDIRADRLATCHTLNQITWAVQFRHAFGSWAVKEGREAGTARCSEAYEQVLFSCNGVSRNTVQWSIDSDRACDWEIRDIVQVARQQTGR